jgi:hypothetical protein
MSCCCNNSYQGLPCCCPTGVETTITTTCPFGICCGLSCQDGEICPEEYVTDCVIYNGDPVTLSCINILPGNTYTEILEAILFNLSLTCPTTTTTTTVLDCQLAGEAVGAECILEGEAIDLICLLEGNAIEI